MVKLLLTFLLFIAINSYSQIENRKVIHCKIIADSTSVEGINVLNLLTEQTAISDEKGAFDILAKADDLLLITSLNLEIKRKLIEDEDLDLDIIKINMIPKMTELKEVRVNENANINAENLGIIPKDQKKYTTAERRLKTAGDFKPIQLLGILGGTLPLDPIFNAINGRTKRLKKELKVEEKERMLLALDVLFDDKFYTKKLHIPNNFISGFKYYLIEEDAFGAILTSKDKSKIAFNMSEMAIKYNQIIENGDN